jgi:hypothetical protein
MPPLAGAAGSGCGRPLSPPAEGPSTKFEVPRRPVAQARSVLPPGLSGHVGAPGVGPGIPCAHERAPDALPSSLSPVLPSRQVSRKPAGTPGQAESRARPRRRRAFTTARPARVDMRCRNPCLRARFRLFGWKVRFISGSSPSLRDHSVYPGPAGHGTRQNERRAMDLQTIMPQGRPFNHAAAPRWFTSPADPSESYLKTRTRQSRPSKREKCLSRALRLGSGPKMSARIPTQGSDVLFYSRVGAAAVPRHASRRRSTMRDPRGFARRPHLWIQVWRTSRPESRNW